MKGKTNIRQQLFEGFDDIKSIRVRIRVNLTGRTYLADILTSIRAIEGAITVSQAAPLEPAPGEMNMLNVNVKFEELPERTIEDFVKKLKMIKGVDMARLLRDDEYVDSLPASKKKEKSKEAEEKSPEKSPPAEKPPVPATPPPPPPPPKKKVPVGTQLIRDLVSEILKRQLR